MLAAVVVTHADHDGRLRRCVDAVRADPDVDLILIVDNGAQPGVAAVAAEVGATLLVVANDGYGAAANRGGREAVAAGADRLILLNDDAIVRPGSIGMLSDELDRDLLVGAVQPKLVFADVDPPTINSLGVAIGADGAGSDIGHGLIDDGGSRPPTDVEVFTGGAVLMSVAFLDDVGWFDERYFLYYEDVDLALRGAEHGWRFRLVPDAVVEHVGSATTATMPDRTTYLLERNRLWAAFRFGDAATCRRACWLSIRRLRSAPRAVHVRALLAGLAGAPGCLIRRRRSGR